MAVATGTALTLATMAATAGTTLTAAQLQARGQSNAAKRQAEAANRAAELQTGSTREALDFEKQQAALEQQRSEADRRANYDQWLAREQRLGSLGQMVGLGARNSPAYVPSMQTAPGAAMTMPGGGMDAARAKFDELFPDATLTPQMVKAKEAELQAAGFTLRPNAQGTVGKIQYGSGPIIDIIQGAGSGLNRKQWLLPQAAAPRAPIGSLGQMANASPMGAPMTAPLTAPIQVPSTAYRAPSRLRDYLRSA
jgi:hypothetical protein